MLLYGYILQLFEDQKLIIDSYTSAAEQVEDEEGEDEKDRDIHEEDDANVLALLPPDSDIGTSLLPTEINANLANVNDPILEREKETPFFWHVPKSGGTTLQRMYFCMGFTLANEVGGNPKFDSDRSRIE